MDKNFKKWSRAVWREADQEEEGVVPSIWNSVSEDVVMWPRGINAIRAMKELRHPDKKWECFELIKVKITSDSRTECDEFDITTTAEVSDEESENELEMGKRIQKKKTYDEFVTGTCLINKKYIMQIGGKDYKEHLNKAMQRCLTNKLMSVMNMKGKKNKEAFGDSNLFKIIRDAVLACHTEATETKVIEQCSNYLKYAPWREGGVKPKE
ncbi:unnamed protein product [Mytilus coruscus]|uniref:BEN domain-containing protein n=1 Tax=Mytilus coruscus TaxID=42192 RepID=A0A6J8CIZ1_MYTCO|nr:unnamed protein product [Mytilus coruscus]